MQLYRIEIETFDERGKTIKFYRFDNQLFSIANKKYLKALCAAKASNAAKIVANFWRFDNGQKSTVSYFQR